MSDETAVVTEEPTTAEAWVEGIFNAIHPTPPPEIRVILRDFFFMGAAFGAATVNNAIGDDDEVRYNDLFAEIDAAKADFTKRNGLSGALND